MFRAADEKLQFSAAPADLWLFPPSIPADDRPPETLSLTFGPPSFVGPDQHLLCVSRPFPSPLSSPRLTARNDLGCI